MATVLLAIPEEHLAIFLKILRYGMADVATEAAPEVLEGLDNWIEEHEEYADRFQQ
mgnify:CR=1 FL=1